MKRSTRIYFIVIIVTTIGIILNLQHVSFTPVANTIIGAIDILALLVLLKIWRSSRRK